MHLALVGLNHKTAPVGLREKLSIAREQLPEALARLTANGTVSEGLILSTCNRMEVYACTPGRAYDNAITEFMSDFCGVHESEFESHIYTSSGHKVAEHLFRVAAGIDSMVLGETQILGQIKDAYSAASGQCATGMVLNTLFQQAATVGKRAHTETSISRGAFSIGSAAVQLARSIFEDLNDRLVLVVGAGKIAKTTVLHLANAGANRLVVANRTYEKGEELACEFGGEAIEFEGISSALETADIVITSTGMKGSVITREMVKPVVRKRRGRPLFFIDIAVPRDVDDSVGKLENVFLYNIDDFQAVVEADNANRSAEVTSVESIVSEESEEFVRWFRTLDAVPVITALREKCECIRQREVDTLSRKLSHLSPEDIAAVQAATKSIVNRICHNPMLQIKDCAVNESPEKLSVICEVFGLCTEDELQVSSSKLQVTEPQPATCIREPETSNLKPETRNKPCNSAT